MSSARDYRKFLREDGRLDVRYLPRAIYLDLLGRYRRQEHVIDEVLGMHFWLWDLNRKAQQALVDGRHVPRAELADELLGEMADDEWWPIMQAFEAHLQAHFAENPAAWAELLDPVYDLNEIEGWRDRHYGHMRNRS